MNPQIEFLPWLSSLFLSSSLFLGLMAVINLLIRKQSASHRHSLQLATACGLPLLVLFSFVSQFLNLSWTFEFPLHSQTQITSFETTTETQVISSKTATNTQAILHNPSPTIHPNSNPSAQKQAPHPLFIVSVFLVVIWILGFLIFIIRNYASIRALKRLKPSEAPSKPLSQQLSEECLAMGISLKPRIIILPKGSMPMTWRFRKHYLGLPQGVENWTSEQVR